MSNYNARLGRANKEKAKKWKLVLLITAAFTVDVVGGTDTR